MYLTERRPTERGRGARGGAGGPGGRVRVDPDGREGAGGEVAGGRAGLRQHRQGHGRGRREGAGGQERRRGKSD